MQVWLSANNALTKAVDAALPPLHHALAVSRSHAHSLYQTIHDSDSPAAQAFVRALEHPRVQAAYARTATLASDQAPLLLSVLGLAVHLYFANRTTRRAQAQLEHQFQQHNGTAMSDYGLGDPAGATAAAGARSSQRSRDDHGLVEVQWGREKIRVPLPPPSSPLSTLRASLYNLTGVPPSHQKLIYSGAVLKDDLAPLSAYGLTDDEPASSSSAADDADNSAKKSFWDSWSFAGRSSSARSGRKLKKLVMLGSKDVSARVDDRLAQRKDLADLAAADAAAAGAAGGEGAAAGTGAAGGKEPESEDALRARIRDVAGQKLDELEPQVRQVEEWLEQAQAQAASGDETAEAPSAPSRTLIFLSEVLLQGLLKLDAFEIPSAYAEARKERKDAVRRVQDTLDRVDRAKEGWKQVGAKP